MDKEFENYLKEKCSKINPTVLDDDMPDFFDNWLGDLNADDWIAWANLYGQIKYLQGKEEIIGHWTKSQQPIK